LADRPTLRKYTKHTENKNKSPVSLKTGHVVTCRARGSNLLFWSAFPWIPCFPRGPTPNTR